MSTNTKLRSFVILVIVAMLTLVSTISFAETYSASMSLTSNSKLVEGGNVIVNINLTSFNSVDGVDVITAVLNYDENVFEVVNAGSFESSTKWNTIMDSDGKKLVIQKIGGTTTPEMITTLTLKVKETVDVDSTVITLKNIVVAGGSSISGGTGDILVNDQSITISKIVPPAPVPEPEPEQEQESASTTISDSTTVKKTTLPKTGISQYGALLIVVVAIVGVGSYFLYKRLAKDIK